MGPASRETSHSVAQGLLERTVEVEACLEAVQAARDGRGRVLLFDGEAGIGKTSVLDVVCEHAHERGVSVLRATGEELERDLPWGIVLQLFGAVLGEANWSGALTGTTRRLAGLLDRGVSLAESAEDTLVLVNGVHRLALNLAEGSGLLVAVDDCQWSDPASLRALHYLCARLEDSGIAVVLAIRSDEALGSAGAGDAGDAGDVVARLRGLPVAERRSLCGLDVESIATLVRRELPAADDAFSDAVHAACSGNPFLAVELVRAACEEGVEPRGASASRLDELRPERIRQSILLRLGRLSAHARRLARAVAVLGAASLRVSATLADLDVRSAGDAAEELLGAGLLADPGRLVFAHPIVREIVYRDLPLTIRREEHLEAARALQFHGASALEVASQLLLTEPGGERWADDAVRCAAAEATSMGAPGEAVRLLSWALQQPGRGDDPGLLLALGRAEAAVGNRRAEVHLRQAAERATDQGERVAALGSLGQVLYVTGDTEQAAKTLGRALDEFEAPGTGGRLEAELLGYLGLASRPAQKLVDDLRQRLAVPRALAGKPTPAELVRHVVLGFDLFVGGRREKAAAHAQWALDHLHDPGLPTSVPPYMTAVLSGLLGFLGRYDNALAVSDELVAEAHRRGSPLDLAVTLESRVLCRRFQGEVMLALADSETLLGTSGEAWDLATIPARVCRSEMLVAYGASEGAAEALAVPEAVEARLAGTYASLWLPYGRGVLAYSAGRWEEAREQALLAGERVTAAQVQAPDYMPWRSLAARATARTGKPGPALELAEHELELAGGPAPRRAAAIALGTVGAIRGTDRGIDELRQAAQLLAEADARLERVRALTDLGATLRRSGWDRDAREPLRSAIDEAGSIGAHAYAREAQEELVASGARRAHRPLSGVWSLTPSELRVASMAAQGMANREIAEHLFLAKRTVETHLTSVYAKLQTRSRTELSAALAKDPPT